MWHVCLRNPFPPFLLGIPSIDSLQGSGSWEPQCAPAALLYACIVLVPSLQLQEKICFMQRIRGFGHGVVVSKVFYNAVIVLSVVLSDCCKPMNNCRDWAFSHSGMEAGLPAFQLPVFEKCDALPKRDLRHVRLRNPSPPFLLRIPSIHSLQGSGSWEPQCAPADYACTMPIPSLQLRKKPVSCREAEELVTELWSPRFVTIQWLCSQLCYVTAANPWTIVEIELLATVGWKWGCQPFSCSCLKNMTRHVCLRNPFLPLLLGIPSIHSLPEASGSREPQNVPPALRYSCIMPIPSLQLQKKTCLTQRSRGFGHGVVVSKICYNTVIVLWVVLCDCCKPMNNCRDWAFSNSGMEAGLPAFQLQMHAKCDELPKGDLFNMFVEGIHSRYAFWQFAACSPY